MVRTLLFAAIASSTATASASAKVGDAQLRSDLQTLASAGAIDDITTHWPIPWAGVIARITQEDAVTNQPAYVREAARRVSQGPASEMRIDDLRTTATIDVTNYPNVIRGFYAMGLGEGQAELSFQCMTPTTAARLSAGIFSPEFSGGKKLFMPDGSYFAQKVGGAVVYAGYLTHWWGPGWISALSYLKKCAPLSTSWNRARQYGSVPITLAKLAWSVADGILVGWFDDKRIATNTYWDGFRFTFNPLPGLQIELPAPTSFVAKAIPRNHWQAIDIQNDRLQSVGTNDEGIIDIHYPNPLRCALPLYTQP